MKTRAPRTNLRNRLEKKMENTCAVNLLFVESHAKCCVEGCDATCKIMDILTGKRFCEKHAPRLWVEEAIRNSYRIEQERQSLPRPCVVW